MRTSLLLFLSLALHATILAQVKPNTGAGGLALEGYDPVSYFNGKPLPGKPALTADYRGVRYRFANEANRSRFLAGPAAFEPAYGGWCAYAVGAKSELVEVDPLTYKIVNGRLLLFYNAWLTNTLTLWNADEPRLAPAAESNWKKLNNPSK